MTKNPQVFNETRGVEQALIQKLVLAVEERYTTDIRNSATGQFTGNLLMIIYYIIVTYGEISPSQLVNLDHNTKTIQYNPQTPINTIFNQVKDLIEYGELARSKYTQIQTTRIAYMIINKTRNFQD